MSAQLVATVIEKALVLAGAGSITQVPGLFVLWGQSNQVGQGNYNITESGYSLVTPISACTVDEALGANLVINWSYFGPTALAPYAAAGGANMGPELTFGRYLLDYHAPWTQLYLSKTAVNGSSLALHWLPTSTFTGGGTKNLFGQACDRVDAAIAASGSRVIGLYWEQGWTDAGNSTDAGNYQTNLGALFTAFRAKYGPVPVVLGKLSPNTAAAFKNTVRAAQVAYVASDSNSRLLPMDPLPLGNGDPHYSGQELCTMGQMAALNLTQMRAPSWVPDLQSGPAPWVQGYDVGVATTGTTLTPRWAVEHKAGDIGIMVVDTFSTDVAATLTDAQGFAEVTSSPGRSVFSTLFVRCHVYWCRATSSAMAAPTVTTNNGQGAARIFVIRGANPVGNPIDVTSVGANNANNTSVSIPGATTSVDNCLICTFFTTDGGGAPKITSSNWANASLAGFGFVQGSDYQPSSAHDLIHMAAGVKAAAGAYGTTTATLSSAAVIASMTIAVKP